MNVETIARRYGTALADVVIEKGETETVKSELKGWEEMIFSSDDLQSALSNPSIAHMAKEKVLESLLARSKPSKTTANFLRVLLKNGRLTEIAEINDKFDSILEERSGHLTAEVISARELSDVQKNELRSNLERLTGKHIRLEFRIDENLIGGVITRVGSTVYDNSVRTKLDNLREQLTNG